MELIKKTFLQSLTTGTTATTNGTEYIIKPDLTACYHMKIGIASKIKDIGFFDSYSTGDTCCTYIKKSVGFEYTDNCFCNEFSDYCSCYVCGNLITTPSMSTSECFDVTFCWYLKNEYTHIPAKHIIDIYCNSNSTPVRNINYSCRNPLLDDGCFSPINIKAGDTLGIVICSSTTGIAISSTSMCVHCVENQVGCYNIGEPPGETIRMIAELSIT